MPLHRPIDHRAQSGTLCGMLLRRSRFVAVAVAVAVAACCLDLFFSLASSSSICCCRHSSLQNGVSPLHAHPHGRASIATTGFLLARIIYLHTCPRARCLPVHKDVLVPAKMSPAPEAGVEVVVVEPLSGVSVAAGRTAGPRRRRAMVARHRVGREAGGLDGARGPPGGQVVVVLHWFLWLTRSPGGFLFTCWDGRKKNVLWSRALHRPIL